MLCRCHNEDSLEVPSHRHEVEFTLYVVQATQQTLAESEYRFDDAEHRFDRALAPGIERLASLGLEPMPHGFHRGGIHCKRRWFGEALQRILMVMLTDS